MEKTILINCSPKKSLSVSGFVMKCAGLMLRGEKVYMQLRTPADECFESRARLYELEEALGSYFVRISKSMIVNLRKLRSVSADPSGRMDALLLNGERVIISRNYVKDIKRRLGLS